MSKKKVASIDYDSLVKAGLSAAQIAILKSTDTLSDVQIQEQTVSVDSIVELNETRQKILESKSAFLVIYEKMQSDVAKLVKDFSALTSSDTTDNYTRIQDSVDEIVEQTGNYLNDTKVYTIENILVEKSFSKPVRYLAGIGSNEVIADFYKNCNIETLNKLEMTAGLKRKFCSNNVSWLDLYPDLLPDINLPKNPDKGVRGFIGFFTVKTGQNDKFLLVDNKKIRPMSQDLVQVFRDRKMTTGCRFNATECIQLSSELTDYFRLDPNVKKIDDSKSFILIPTSVIDYPGNPEYSK